MEGVKVTAIISRQKQIVKPLVSMDVVYQKNLDHAEDHSPAIISTSKVVNVRNSFTEAAKAMATILCRNQSAKKVVEMTGVSIYF
jgi:hypothetical protein